MNDIATIASELGGQHTHGNTWQCLCPAHDDENASLTLSLSGSGKILFYCHAGCSQGAVMSSLSSMGLWGKTNKEYESVTTYVKRRIMAKKRPKQKPAGKLVKTYDYTGIDDDLIFQVCRFLPKGFRQRRPDGSGGWVWNLNDVKRVLYNFRNVTESDEIYIPEGEKNADAVNGLGLVATTNACGAGKWDQDYSETLSGKHCIILPDNDEPGVMHAEIVASALDGIAKSVCIVTLPGLAEKGDVYDWIMAGGTMNDLKKLVRYTRGMI